MKTKIVYLNETHWDRKLRVELHTGSIHLGYNLATFEKDEKERGSVTANGHGIVITFEGDPGMAAYVVTLKDLVAAAARVRNKRKLTDQELKREEVKDE